jgi:hypothetical protein
MSFTLCVQCIGTCVPLTSLEIKGSTNAESVFYSYGKNEENGFLKLVLLWGTFQHEHLLYKGLLFTMQA